MKWNKSESPPPRSTFDSGLAVRAAAVAGVGVVDRVDDGAAAGRVAGGQAYLGQAAQRQRPGGAQEPEGEVSDFRDASNPNPGNQDSLLHLHLNMG